MRGLATVSLLAVASMQHALFAEDAPPPPQNNDEKIFSADTDTDHTEHKTGEATKEVDKLESLEKTLGTSGSAAWSDTDHFQRISAFGILGIQNDSLDWTVKLGSVTEKTSWSISSLQMGLGINAELSNEINVYLDYRFSMTHDGDADNSLSSPANKYSGDSEDGSYQRLSLGASYLFPIDDKWLIGPHLGFFESTQEYQIKNSNITGPSVNAAIEALDSRFDTTWNGMLIGAEARFIPNDQWTVFFKLDLSLLDYEGEGRLNLRPDLERKSFTQSGDGVGLDFSIHGIYQYNDKLRFHGLLIFSDWNVDGSEKRYPTVGATVNSNLDESHYSSFLIGGGASYAF